MKQFLHFISILLCHLIVVTAIAQNIDESERLFSKGQIQFKKGNKHKAEEIFQKVLILNPHHYKAHDYIRMIYDQGYTSIPLMACYRMALISYKTTTGKDLYKMIDYYAHRFITRTDSGNIVHVAPYFVRQMDTVFENNISVMEAGFIAAGSLDFPANYDTLNDAEKLIRKLKFIFERHDQRRSNNYGFYWDYYIDYFADLSKTSHLKTACYMIFYRKDDIEIKNWIDNNPLKVKEFDEWDKQELRVVTNKNYKY